jgi:hypothetical protein
LIALTVDPNAPEPAVAGEASGSVENGAALSGTAETQRAQSSDHQGSAQEVAPDASVEPVRAPALASAEKPDEQAARAEAKQNAPKRVRLFRVREPVRRPPARWFRLGTAFGLWGANLAGPQENLLGRAGFGSGVLYMELNGGWAFARDEVIERAPAARVRLATGQLGVAGCALWGAGFRVGPCLGIVALYTKGSVTGITQPTHAASWWAQTALSLQAGFVAYRAIELLFEGGAGFPLSARPRFDVEGIGTVAEAAHVAGFARFGIGVRTR